MGKCLTLVCQCKTSYPANIQLMPLVKKASNNQSILLLYVFRPHCFSRLKCHSNDNIFSWALSSVFGKYFDKWPHLSLCTWYSHPQRKCKCLEITCVLKKNKQNTCIQAQRQCQRLVRDLWYGSYWSVSYERYYSVHPCLVPTDGGCGNTQLRVTKINWSSAYSILS